MSTQSTSHTQQNSKTSKDGLSEKKGTGNQGKGKSGRRVVIHNHYYGGPGPADHLERTKQEKKKQSDPTGSKPVDTAIIDYNKSKFEDFAKRANSLFESDPFFMETPADIPSSVIYTDCYSTESVATVAVKWFESVTHAIPDSMFKFDAACVAAYADAACQLTLMANDDIVGVNGFTREMVADAKAILQDWYIPECVVTAIAGLRPIHLIDCDTSFVLLPYKLETAAHVAITPATGIRYVAAIPAQGQNQAVPPRFDVQLVPPSFWKKSVGSLPQAVVVAEDIRNSVRRHSVFIKFMNDCARNVYQIGAFGVTAHAINSLVGHTITSVSGAGFDLFGPQFRQNAGFVRNVYETLTPMSGKLLKLKDITKLATGLGSQTFHKPRYKDRLPIHISTAGDADVIRWMEYDPLEKLTPWFAFETRDTALAFARATDNIFGNYFQIIKIPSPMSVMDMRFLAYVDNISLMLKGDPGPFRGMRSRYGF